MMSELTIQNTKEYIVVAIFVLFYFCNGSLIFLAPEHAGCNNNKLTEQEFLLLNKKAC